ncbi:MAG: type II secretion system protein GspM [Janthinobacterium lividum]
MTSSRFAITLGRPLGASLLLGGLLIVGVAAVWASWADLSAAVAERDAKAELLDHSIAASRRAALQPGATPLSDPFVVAQTATLAAAQVDADLREIANSSGMTLTSSRADAKPDDPGTAGEPNGLGTRIEDQATVEGQNDALQSFLIRLETGGPIVLVDALAVEPAEVNQTSLADPQAPRLRITLTISAYWRPSVQNQAPQIGRQ